MQTASEARKTVIDLENKFWQSLVDADSDSALNLLDEPALMVNSHGAMQFDHAAYRRMVEQGTMIVKSFELSDMKVLFPKDDLAVLTYHAKQTLSSRGKSDEIKQEMENSSVWTRKDGRWQCVMHTESPMAKANN